MLTELIYVNILIYQLNISLNRRYIAITTKINLTHIYILNKSNTHINMKHVIPDGQIIIDV